MNKLGETHTNKIECFFMPVCLRKRFICVRRRSESGHLHKFCNVMEELCKESGPKPNYEKLVNI